MEWIVEVINSRRYKYLMNNYRNEEYSKYALLYTYLCSLTLFPRPLSLLFFVKGIRNGWLLEYTIFK